MDYGHPSGNNKIVGEPQGNFSLAADPFVNKEGINTPDMAGQTPVMPDNGADAIQLAKIEGIRAGNEGDLEAIVGPQEKDIEQAAMGAMPVEQATGVVVEKTQTEEVFSTSREFSKGDGKIVAAEIKKLKADPHEGYEAFCGDREAYLKQSFGRIFGGKTS